MLLRVQTIKVSFVRVLLDNNFQFAFSFQLTIQMTSTNQDLEVITYDVVLEKDLQEVLNLLGKDFFKVKCETVEI